jgi:hypothetical protein
MRLHYSKHPKTVQSKTRRCRSGLRFPRQFPHQALRRIFRHKCPKNRLIKLLTSQGGGR